VTAEDEIHTCNYLFLTDIRGLGRNRLKLFLSEGCLSGEIERIVIGDQSVPGSIRIDISANSRVLETVRTSYITYSVISGSYASSSGPEANFEGRLFRTYSESPTRMGIQVCDQNGRVRAILPLANTRRASAKPCFGGRNFDVLYVTDGAQVLTRRLKVSGLAPWEAPVPVASQGPG
jgi:hypothetical protein